MPRLINADDLIRDIVSKEDPYHKDGHMLSIDYIVQVIEDQPTVVEVREFQKMPKEKEERR